MNQYPMEKSPRLDMIAVPDSLKESAKVGMLGVEYEWMWGSLAPEKIVAGEDSRRPFVHDYSVLRSSNSPCWPRPLIVSCA